MSPFNWTELSSQAVHLFQVMSGHWSWWHHGRCPARARQGRLTQDATEAACASRVNRSEGAGGQGGAGAGARNADLVGAWAVVAGGVGGPGVGRLTRALRLARAAPPGRHPHPTSNPTSYLPTSASLGVGGGGPTSAATSPKLP
jgi:hypothetical protein